MLKETRIAMAFMLLAALAIFAPRTLAQQSSTRPASTAPAKTFVPFTLVTQNYVYDSSGTRGLVSDETVARRNDGATVTMNFQPQHAIPSEPPHRRFIQFLDGRQWEIYDAIHAFVKWPPPLKPLPAVEQLLSPKSCLEPLAGEYFEKYTTLGGVKVAVVASLPKGSFGLTRWLAPELSCQELQQTYTQVKADGSLRLVSEKKFVSLKLGPPDANFFSVPSSYASLTPAVALHEEAEKTGQPWDARMQDAARQMQGVYARRLKESRANPH